MWQINQKLLNFHFTNAINQKVIKTKFVNNYRAYDRMKNKIITMQRNSLHIFIKEWTGHSLWKIKHLLLGNTKLNFSVTFVSQNK